MSVANVVFATDFSEAAEAAAVVAREYARLLDARLHVLHVTSPDAFGATREQRCEADAVHGVDVTIGASGGDPAEAICRYADRVSASLIVLGTHGRTGVSERVIRRAPVPVLAVPPGAAHSAAPAHPAPSSHCVVCTAASADIICAACRTVLK